MLKNAKYSDLSKWLTTINNNLGILPKFSCTKIFNVFQGKVIVRASKMFVHLQIYASWNLYSSDEVFLSVKKKSWNGFLFRKSSAYCCNAFFILFYLFCAILCPLRIQSWHSPLPTVDLFNHIPPMLMHCTYVLFTKRKS